MKSATNYFTTNCYLKFAGELLKFIVKNKPVTDCFLDC